MCCGAAKSCRNVANLLKNVQTETGLCLEDSAARRNIICLCYRKAPTFTRRPPESQSIDGTNCAAQKKSEPKSAFELPGRCRPAN
jgi:hypothetical protein